MNRFIDHAALVFACSFVALWLSARFVAYLRRRRLEEALRQDFGIILFAALTLNSLIIGFSFSIAIIRYEQRKTYEAAEANAIGTEYGRAGLLSAADAAKVRSLLRDYLDQRLSFYTAGNESHLSKIHARTAQLQAELWAVVRDASVAQSTSMAALAVAGMNDVINSQGYTRAAWWNRIPVEAWILMASISAVANGLFVYDAQNIKAKSILLMILPAVLSVCFLLIADIESPRGGLIHVNPNNLASLAESLRAA